MLRWRVFFCRAIGAVKYIEDCAELPERGSSTANLRALVVLPSGGAYPWKHADTKE